MRIGPSLTQTDTAELDANLDALVQLPQVPQQQVPRRQLHLEQMGNVAKLSAVQPAIPTEPTEAVVPSMDTVERLMAIVLLPTAVNLAAQQHQRHHQALLQLRHLPQPPQERMGSVGRRSEAQHVILMELMEDAALSMAIAEIRMDTASFRMDAKVVANQHLLQP